MFQNIAVIGSRNLACKIFDRIVKQDNKNIIGDVAPPFRGWWDNKFKTH